MGCDIHMFIERRLDSNHKWEMDSGHQADPEENDHINSVDAVGRWYQMFFTMAGIRGGDQQLFEPRGVPDDASELGVKAMDQYGVDGHSHSWLTLEEMKLCIETASGKKINYEAKPEAFFNYTDYKWDDPKRPKDWDSMITYAEKWIKDTKEAERDIAAHLRSEPEVRFLFFFDN